LDQERHLVRFRGGKLRWTAEALFALEITQLVMNQNMLFESRHCPPRYLGQCNPRAARARKANVWECHLLLPVVPWFDGIARKGVRPAQSPNVFVIPQTGI